MKRKGISTGLAVAACAVPRCGICQKLSPNNRCSKSNQTDSPNFLPDATPSAAPRAATRLRFVVGPVQSRTNKPMVGIPASNSNDNNKSDSRQIPRKAAPTQTDAATCCFETEPRAAGVAPVCSLANCYLPAPRHLETSSAGSARHSGR